MANMEEPTPPELARVGTAELNMLRSLLPGLGDDRGHRDDDRDSVSASSASLYYSAAGSSSSASPRGPPSPSLSRFYVEDGLTGKIQGLVETLSSEDDPIEALSSLASFIDMSHGEAASGICAMMRSCGAMRQLVQLLDAPSETAPAVTQHALVLIGNLASADVDPIGSKHARKQLREVGGFLKMMDHVDSSDELTVLYALGAIQNTCGEIEYVYAMQQAGLVGKLQAFVGSGDENLASFARACLANMRETILHAAAARRHRAAAQ